MPGCRQDSRWAHVIGQVSLWLFAGSFDLYFLLAAEKCDFLSKASLKRVSEIG